MNDAKKAISFLVGSGILLAVIAGCITLYNQHLEHGMQIIQMKELDQQQLETVHQIVQKQWELQLYMTETRTRLQALEKQP